MVLETNCAPSYSELSPETFCARLVTTFLERKDVTKDQMMGGTRGELFLYSPALPDKQARFEEILEDTNTLGSIHARVTREDDQYALARQLVRLVHYGGFSSTISPEELENLDQERMVTVEGPRFGGSFSSRSLQMVIHRDVSSKLLKVTRIAFISEYNEKVQVK